MSKSRSQKSKNTAEKQKTSFDKRLAVANIVLTAIVGIGVAIYLQIRNENFQKGLQDAEDIKSIASLTINPFNTEAQYSAGGFSIQNDGATNATNIRILICLKSVSRDWENTLSDISFFHIYLSNPSLDLRTENNKSPQCRSLSGNNNSILVTLSSLSPNSLFSITLSPNVDLENSQIISYFYSDIAVLFPLEMEGENCAISVQNFFRKRYYIAEFESSVSCDNCAVNDSKYDFFLSDIFAFSHYRECISPFKYSTYQGSGFDYFLFERIVPNFVDYKYSQKSIKIDDPFYLWISESGIEEISKDRYIQIAK